MAPRLLRPCDADAIAALLRHAFAAQSAPTDPPSAALREDAASIRAWLATGGGAGMTERDDGPLRAAVLWRAQANGLYVGRLAVHPRWRRRGLARRLLAACEAEARRRGLPCVRLSTRVELAETRRLFQGAGYVETSRHAHPGYDRPTSIAFEKTLLPAD